MTGIAEAAVLWAADAGHTVATDVVLTALCEVDRDNRAADQAFSDTLGAGDFAATHEVVRNQISFIEVYVLRVLVALGVAVLVQDTGSWWAHLADQAHAPSPYPRDLPTR